MLRWTAAVLLLVLSHGSSCAGYLNLEVGDPCGTSYKSSCQPVDNCNTLQEFLRNGKLTVTTVVNCGFTTHGEKICCPVEDPPVGSVESRQQIPAVESTTGTTMTRMPASSASTTRTTTATPKMTTRPPLINNSDWISIFNTQEDYVKINGNVTTPVENAKVFHVTTPASLLTGGPDFMYTGPSDILAGTPCHTPKYRGECYNISQCSSVERLLGSKLLTENDVKRCHYGVYEEVICCPADVPILPRHTELDNKSEYAIVSPPPPLGSSITPTAGAATSLQSHYTHLAALGYFNDDYDGFVHQCTALVLRPQLLLTSAGCSRLKSKTPNHALFGVADLRQNDVDVDYLMEISNITTHRNDLALLELLKPLELGNRAKANVSLTPFCTNYEQTRLITRRELVASAWGISNSSECMLYEQPVRLLQSSACLSIGNANVNPVLDLHTSHLCVGLMPKTASSPAAIESCQPCLARGGSMLHMVRLDGSRCALGVATPTVAQCDAQVLYYTSFSSPHFSDFIMQAIQTDPRFQQHQATRA